MMTRTCIAFLCCILIACGKPGKLPDTSLSEIENISRLQNYSTDDFINISRIFQKSDGNISLRLFYYNYASTYYRLVQNYGTAMAYADSMLDIAGTISQDTLLIKARAQAYIRKADVLYCTRQYKDCYYYYGIGSIEAGKLQDPGMEGEINTHLSWFLYEQGNYDSAIFYFKQLLKDVTGASASYDNLIYNQGILNDIGMCFLRQSRSDKALDYFSKALVSISQAADLMPKQKDFCQMALGVVYGNMAQAHQQSGKYNLAKELYKKSIAINSQPRNANGNALLTQQQLAGLYYQQGDLPALHLTLLQIKMGMDTIADKNVERQWNYLMGRYYNAMHDPPAALLYINHYLALKEEEAGIAKPLVQSDIIDELKNMQSDYDLTISEKDNQLKNACLAGAAFIFLLTLTVTLQFFKNLKKTRKSLSKHIALNKEIKNKKAELEEVLLQLEARNNEKRHILHVVAHDLRNPLSVIKALTTVIEEEYENEELNRESLSTIKTVCAESNELIGSLLEVAESDRVTYRYEAVDVNKIMATSLAVLRIRAKEKNQSITFLAVQERVMIRGDAAKINRLVSNLITNAIKFSPSGSRIEAGIYTSDSHVRIQIRDYGIGIPGKYHNSVFNTFTSAKRPGTEGEKTFGLGLSICKQIVENHNGKIWFTSAEKQGTTFFIEFEKLKEETVEF